MVARASRQSSVWARTAAALATPMLLCLAVGGLAPVSAHTLESTSGLYLGKIKYHAEQRDYLAALVDLLVALDNHRLDDKDPQVRELMGRLQLGLGLYDDARSTLDSVLDAGDGETSNQVWLTLAVDASQRNMVDRGLAALDHIRGSVDPELAARASRLRATLTLQGERFERAITLLQPLARQPDTPIFGYNLAVAKLRAGRTPEALQELRRLVTIQAFDEVTRTLRDRAGFLLGISLAKAGQYDDASESLRSVRLHGPLGTRALLASGHILATQGQQDRALVPWKLMRQRSVLDPAVQEAWIRVGEVLYEQRRYQDAAYAFEEAVDAFERALRQLDATRGMLADGRLIASLRKLEASDLVGANWMSRLLAVIPEARVLGESLASGRFQREFRVHREINVLHRNLLKWQRDVFVFESMLKQHRELFAKRAPWIGEKLDSMSLSDLQKQARDYQRELDRAERGARPDQFESAAELAWTDLLRRFETHLPDLPAADRESMRQRIRLLKSRIVWNREIEFDARVQRLRASLVEAGEQLKDADRELSRIQTDRQQAPTQIERRMDRVGMLGQRVDELLPRVEAVLAEQESVLTRLALAELDRVQARLATRKLEARTLLARNYDTSIQARLAGASP